jgi:dihydroflavonol-4-reductase
MKVFLTGGTGFIGQPLARALLARGWSVTALVRRPDGAQARALAAMGAELSAGDVTAPESMRAGMAGADIVVHNAGHYELGVNAAGRRRMQDVNVRGTDNVLRLAQELECPRTVYVSTALACGDTGPQTRDESFVRRAPPRSFYERSKAEAHELARRYQQRGLPLVIVSPGAVIGANDHSAWGHFLRLYINRRMPPVGWSPDSVLCCVAAGDLAAGITLAADRGRSGETYILGGDLRTLREHMMLWGSRPGAMLPVVWLPAPLAAVLFAPLEALQRMLGLPAFISRETVRSSAMQMRYSSAKAMRDLGWTYRPAEAMWLETLDREIELRDRRGKCSLVRRLAPLDVVE